MLCLRAQSINPFYEMLLMIALTLFEKFSELSLVKNLGPVLYIPQIFILVCFETADELSGGVDHVRLRFDEQIGCF